jgi:VWFA-related protein
MKLKNAAKWWCSAVAVGAMLFLLAIVALGQNQQSKPEIPDAPSAKKPPSQFPTPPPVNTAPMPESEQVPSSSKDTQKTEPQDLPQPEYAPTAVPPPMPPVKTVPEGGATPDEDVSNEKLFTVTKTVNSVLVPVTVKDLDGHLVHGLLPKDFAVFENGAPQQLAFFTSDPAALSAAVVFDLGMPDVAVRKLNQTFPSLEGAFAAFDRVAVYTYSSAVRRVRDFNALNRQLSDTLQEMKTETGRNNGPPVIGGPLGSGPIINGAPMDPSQRVVITPPQETHALNDALLAAATDLGKQPRDRRKIIFIVSDGREMGSRASYKDVLKILLTNEVTVYAVAVDASALPGFNKLRKINLPRRGYGNILPKYASATGGQVFSEFSKDAMEAAYSDAMGDARNQYTLAYYAKARELGYREIEVRVAKPGLKVYAKAGYYPTPPAK